MLGDSAAWLGPTEAERQKRESLSEELVGMLAAHSVHDVGCDA